MDLRCIALLGLNIFTGDGGGGMWIIMVVHRCTLDINASIQLFFPLRIALEAHIFSDIEQASVAYHRRRFPLVSPLHM